LRPRLFGIAYRMLGSAAEAEDIVQEVWLRWQSANRSAVENPPAFLATTTTRLCINLLGSAYMRRETSIAMQIAEPVDTSSDPGVHAERGEALQLAVSVLVEKLSPIERAAYVLREAFDYSHREIADILQIGEANARQIVSRARKHIAEGRCTTACTGGRRRLAEAAASKTATNTSQQTRRPATPSDQQSTSFRLADVLARFSELGSYSLSFNLAG
jgi:RNA polymerase sigma-70 factor (ECF subfamily)